ncbi:MAG: hypothetical protein FWF46_05265 [Oscillospiraceae bacterium]|nr:hypothetical protein [Oscillospiraceae bacterium]
MRLTNKSVDLLNKKDLEFLDSYEMEIKELQNKLNLQKNKREKVLTVIDKVDPTTTNEILNTIQENIKFLSLLKNDLQNLQPNIVDFMIKLNYGSDSKSEEAESIQTILDNISEDYTSVENKVSINDTKIDAFINSNIHTEESSLPQTAQSTHSNEVIEENNMLIISEKDKTVFLPYTQNDLQKYFDKFPKSYKNLTDVIQKQFILPLEYFKHYSVSRFREGYSLMRNKEGKTILDSLKFGINLMFQTNLHPAIITACRTEDDFNEYLNCLENDSTEDFNKFIIKFEIAPLKV